MNGFSASELPSVVPGDYHPHNIWPQNVSFRQTPSGLVQQPISPGEHSLKGGANVLIFPNLESGNIAYKLMQRVGGAELIGPMLTGLSRPVHILQRGSEVNDIVHVAAVAVVDAQEVGKPYVTLTGVAAEK